MREIEAIILSISFLSKNLRKTLFYGNSKTSFFLWKTSEKLF